MFFVTVDVKNCRTLTPDPWFIVDLRVKVKLVLCPYKTYFHLSTTRKGNIFWNFKNIPKKVIPKNTLKLYLRLAQVYMYKKFLYNWNIVIKVLFL